MSSRLSGQMKCSGTATSAAWRRATSDSPAPPVTAAAAAAALVPMVLSLLSQSPLQPLLLLQLLLKLLLRAVLQLLLQLLVMLLLLSLLPHSGVNLL